MLKLYTCPKCKAFRYVSKKNTFCYKCNTKMTLSKVSYSQFIKMDAEARKGFLEQSSLDSANHS